MGVASHSCLFSPWDSLLSWWLCCGTEMMLTRLWHGFTVLPAKVFPGWAVTVQADYTEKTKDPLVCPVCVKIYVQARLRITCLACTRSDALEEKMLPCCYKAPYQGAVCFELSMKLLMLLVLCLSPDVRATIVVSIIGCLWTHLPSPFLQCCFCCICFSKRVDTDSMYHL